MGNFPPFRGMSQPDFTGGVGDTYTGDPATISPNQFFYLQNVRFTGGSLVCRGGLSKANQEAEDGCIVGIFDDRNSLTPGLLFLITQTLPADPALLNFDTTAVVLRTLQGTETGYCFGVGPDATTDTLEVDPTYYFLSTTGGNKVVGNTAGASTFSSGSFEAAFLSGALSSPYPSSTVYDGTNLYVGVAQGAGNDPKTYKFDGTVLTLEDTPISGSGQYGVKLFASISGEIMAGLFQYGGAHPTIVRRRNAGTWSNLALPVGVASFSCISTAQAFSKVYLGGYTTANRNGMILVWDGATLATTGAGPFSNNIQILSIETFNDELYFLYRNNVGLSAATQVHIGKFDGTTWSIPYVSLHTDFPELLGDSNPQMALKASHGKLCLVAGISTGCAVYTSAGADTTTWEQAATSTHTPPTTVGASYPDSWILNVE